jgi:hypothetical protein
MVAIASDLSNDFIVIALACWGPHFLVAFGSTRDLLLSAKYLFVAASPLFLEVKRAWVDRCEPGRRSLATPLGRSGPAQRFVQSRQRFVRWSQTPRHGGSGLAPDLLSINSVIART